MKDLTAGSRKLLLLYDAYRSHMSFEALSMLDRGGIFTYAIPSHTSGATQPLDVGTFGRSKQRVNEVLRNVSFATRDNALDVFDICNVMREAYQETFIPRIIKGSFEKSGVCPFDPSNIIGVLRPLSSEFPSSIASVEEMKCMLNEKREAFRQNAGIQPVFLTRGFVDTAAGCVLTSAPALELLPAKEAAERRKAMCALRKEDAKEAKFAVESIARRRDREAYKHRMMFYRAAAYNAPMKMPRSVQLRRKLARQRAIMNKAFANGTESLTDEQIVTEPWNEFSCDQFMSEPFTGR